LTVQVGSEAEISYVSAEEIILERIATICLQKFVFMPRNELIERSVRYVAHVRRIDEPVRIPRHPLGQSAREDPNQSAAKKLILTC